MQTHCERSGAYKVAYKVKVRKLRGPEKKERGKREARIEKGESGKKGEKGETW